MLVVDIRKHPEEVIKSMEWMITVSLFFNPHLRIFFFIAFRERGRRREREGGRETSVERETLTVASCMHPTWDQTNNPGTCPARELNP